MNCSQGMCLIIVLNRVTLNYIFPNPTIFLLKKNIILKLLHQWEKVNREMNIFEPRFSNLEFRINLPNFTTFRMWLF